MKKVRTRYAPSPTGKLHIGGARTALFSFLYAKHFNGNFIVRIEDTDVSRNIADSEKSQLNNLKWLGIIPDESFQKPNLKYGAYRQTEKLDRYNELIDQLLKSNQAYKSYENTQELLNQKEQQKKLGIKSFRYQQNQLSITNKEKKRRNEKGEYTIRLKLKPNVWYSWNDIVRKQMSINTNNIGDFIIRKQDGYPTYNFAVVVDDYDMQISHILRGEEHLTNTPKQLAIYDAFGWIPPKFGHLSIITNMEGKKLSKRDLQTQQFIEDYKKMGYHSQAIFNFLALLGWTHFHAKELLSKNELIKSFEPNRLIKSPAKFNIKKMNWFSKQYIKNMANKDILKYVNIQNKNDAWINLFISTYKENAITYLDFQKAIKIYENTNVKKQKHNNVTKVFAQELNKLDFNIINIQKAIENTQKITKKQGKNLFMPIRKITTYQEHGSELTKVIYLFGETLIKERLK